jgi:opine dehydrogenase
MSKMHIGIAGTGGIGLASAAALASAGHDVTVWSPRGDSAAALRAAPLQAKGVIEASVRVRVAASPAELAAAPVLLIAVPVNGHKAVMDRLLPYLDSGHTVIVSSMASLSALYLYEQAARRGIDITVAGMGTTVLTARRTGATQVQVMTRRGELGVSAVPGSRIDDVLRLCAELFGDVFVAQANCLASTLTNINPVAHGPLALFNWTRIERAENWPQYHYMTPQVAHVILRLDAERLALARAFGVHVRTIEEHFAKSFGTAAPGLPEIAAELHAKRGGPPGPTDTSTRFLAEDMPFGLAFCVALGGIAGVPMPATRAILDTAGLVVGRDLAADNDLIGALGLPAETLAGLKARVDA